MKRKFVEREYKFCSVCGKKIGWFRKWNMKLLDKDPLHLIPLSQFCSSKCADEGLMFVMEKIKNEKIKM